MGRNSKKGSSEGNLFSLEDMDYGELKDLYGKVKEKLEIIEKKKLDIPLCIFSSKLSGLETIVKYLKENLKLEFKEISSVLGRSVNTVWQAYNFSKKKYSSALRADDFSITIPVLLFKNRKLSVLENIVVCLKGKGMKFSEIAKRLERDPRTIWTVYSRARKKNVR